MSRKGIFGLLTVGVWYLIERYESHRLRQHYEEEDETYGGHWDENGWHEAKGKGEKCYVSVVQLVDNPAHHRLVIAPWVVAGAVDSLEADTLEQAREFADIIKPQYAKLGRVDIVEELG